MARRRQSLARLLGYGEDQRLLIINADDFGMCHGENAATIEGLLSRAFSSSTIMVPCPWFDDAAEFARSHRDADLGVHITHTSEWDTYRWGPLCGPAAVPSMVDSDGKLHADVESFYARADLREVERETRAQIERALAAGIDVTHLDSHMGTLQLEPRYHRLYVELAAEYRLPIRMASPRLLEQMGMGDVVDLADSLGVLYPDHFCYGGPDSPGETPAYWTKLLGRLQPGVTEIYVHAAIGTPEMRRITDSWEQRQADFELFHSATTRGWIADQGIVMIGYRPIRELQRSLNVC